MPEEISVMKTKLDTLRDAFVNGSVIAEQEKLGLENISFVTQNEKLWGFVIFLDSIRETDVQSSIKYFDLITKNF